MWAACAPPAEMAIPRTVVPSASSRTPRGPPPVSRSPSSSTGGLAQVQLRHVDLRLRAGTGLHEPVEEGPELQRPEEPPHLIDVPRAHPAVLRLDVEGHVRDDARQLLVQGQAVQGRRHVLLQLPLQVLDVGHQLLDGAVLRDELRGRLVAHAGHAGDVVRGVALERHEVQIGGGRDPVALQHRGLVVDHDVADALAVEHDPDPGPHELEEVAVRGHDGGLDAPLGGADGQRAQHVVRLVAVHDAKDGDLQRLQDLLDEPELGPEIPGHLRPSGLVLGVLLQAHGGRARVERHGDEVGLLLGQQLDEHRGEPVDRVRDLTGAGGQRGRQREERPIREAVAVEQEEPRRRVRFIEGCHGRIVVAAADALRPEPRVDSPQPHVYRSFRPRCDRGRDRETGPTWSIGAAA